MSSFACPHFDEAADRCLRLHCDCVPGRPGCVLRSTSVSLVPAEERVREREQRNSKRVAPDVTMTHLEGRIQTMQTTQAFFDLTAADLMSCEVITVPQEMSLPVATQVLAQAQIGGAPVVDSEGRCIGVFSTADLARRTQLEKRAVQKAPTVPGCVCSDWSMVEHEWDTLPAESVSWYMTADPVLVPPETRIGELAKMMVDAHIHRLIVAGADRRPTGIVSSTDVLAAVARAAREQSEPCIRPNS
jgi:CBS-domain-containing membrane protein